MWTLRIIRPVELGGGAVAGVPVTLLDDRGDAAGYWVSDAEGLVALPITDAPRIRLRIGLRNENPVAVETTALAAGPSPFELPAPRDFPLALATSERAVAAATAPRSAVASAAGGGSEPPGHVLRFTRLLALAAPPEASGPLAERVAIPAATGVGDAASTAGLAADFFEPATHFPTALRYGALVEIEQYWHPLGYASGDLLYTVALPPGDEARIAVVDGRWEGAGGRSGDRPLQVLARRIGSPTLAELVTGEPGGGGAPPLDPLTLPSEAAGLAAALAHGAADTAALLNARALAAAEALRRAPLSVVELGGASEPPPGAAARTLRNGRDDRLLLYHIYEPLQRYRVSARAARLRPAILVPFRPPNLAVRAMVRQFGALLRRALLDRDLTGELDALLGLDAGQGGDWQRAGAGPPISELRVIVEPGPNAPAPELGQLWCYLRADDVRYTVHFFPAAGARGAAGGPLAAAGSGSHWIGAIRLADFHERPLRYPGELTLENGSRVSLVFTSLHLEGRVGDSWRRLLSVADLAFPAQSRVQLASLASLVGAAGLAGRESRLLGHVSAHLPYYAAAIIAGGDPGVRYLALARLRDAAHRSVADIIDNTVAGVVGNYIAFPLLAADYLPPELRPAFDEAALRPGGPRPPAETAVTFPLPGVWLSAQAGAAIFGVEGEDGAGEERGGAERPRGGRRLQA